MPGLPVHRQLPEFIQTHLHWSLMPSNHLILCRPLFLLPSIFPSINVFSNESALYIRWPKYWSFSFSISPSDEYSGLISFRIDWFDLLTVQGTLKSLHQHHSLKVSVLQFSAFFMGQLSHLLEKDPRPGPLFEGNPVGEGTTRRGTATPVHRPHEGNTEVPSSTSSEPLLPS